MERLDDIQAALIGYTSLLTEQVEANEEHPVRQLLVQLPDPSEDAAAPTLSSILRMFCAETPGVSESLLHTTRDNKSEGPDTGASEVSSVLYFVVRYPQEITPVLSGEIQRLLGVLNHLLPLGTLELDPEEGLFFRHMLLTEAQSNDSLLVLDIVLSIATLLPPVFRWVQEVLSHAVPGTVQEPLKDRFRQLLQQTPVLETLKLPPASTAPSSPAPLRRETLATAGLVLTLLMTLSTSLLAGPLWGLALGLCVLTTCSSLGMLYLQRNARWQERRDQLRQLRFYWQLLEVEAIKLSSQDHALDQQQQQIEVRLTELAEYPVAYPSDIVRLRQQMLALRQLQTRLLERAQQLHRRRQELEQSRLQLQQERLSLLPAASPLQLESHPQLGPDLSPEDLLMQNLVVTLEYLDFKVRTLTQQNTPVIEVFPRPGAPAISIRWLQRWHLAPHPPEHTWMLCFDLTLPEVIPPAVWPRVQELLHVFNRFLPLGTLLCDYRRNQLTLRYRFVRLRGDLSTLLVMEILEVMACFGERLQMRLRQCLDPRKQLELILAETEQDFMQLQY